MRTLQDWELLTRPLYKPLVWESDVRAAAETMVLKLPGKLLFESGD